MSSQSLFKCALHKLLHFVLQDCSGGCAILSIAVRQTSDDPSVALQEVAVEDVAYCSMPQVPLAVLWHCLECCAQCILNSSEAWLRHLVIAPEHVLDLLKDSRFQIRAN